MKKLLALVACSIALAGCSEQDVKNVQGRAVQICSYLPTFETVVNIFVANPILNSGEVIAGQICNAVTNRPLADGPGDRKPRVSGVVVRGRFVK